MTAVYVLLNLFWQWFDWIEIRPERIKQESSPTRPPWAASADKRPGSGPHSGRGRGVIGGSEAS
jgi:hypothetical protein